MSDNSKKPTTALQKTANSLWHAVVLGLTFSLASVVSFAQTASVHDHNIFHGAGTAFVNTSPQAQAVGDGGVLRAQLIWQVTPGQTKGADLDIHAKLPNGAGPYTVTQFDPVGALPGTPQKTPPFGNPNTASDGNQQVNWVNRQVVFSNGQAVASLDQDNRTGVANAPTGKLVENIYLQGTTNPNYIPSGVYQFAVHNYNQTKLADPTASYAVWITTNGRVGARSTTHSTLYENTANPTQPAFYGTLTAEGQSSEIYGIEIITPAGETPHAPGITVVDAKRKYLNAWHAEQSRLAEIRRQAALYHQAMAERSPSQDASRIDWGGCPPPMVCQPSFLNANSTPAMLAWTDANAQFAGFKSQGLPPLNAAGFQNPVTYKDPRFNATLSAPTGNEMALQSNWIGSYYLKPDGQRVYVETPGVEKVAGYVLDGVSAVLVAVDILDTNPIYPGPDASLAVPAVQGGKAAVKEVAPEIITFATKLEARSFFKQEVGMAANKFFRDAAKNAEQFKATVLENGNVILEFFSPARNAGYGKLYRQVVDSAGNVISEVKINMHDGIETLIKELH